MPGMAFLPKSVKQRQCYLAFTEVVAGRLAYLGVFFEVIEDIVTNLETETE